MIQIKALTVLLLLFLICSMPALTDAMAGTTTSVELPDTIKATDIEPLESRPVSDRIISTPTQLVYLPVRLTLLGLRDAFVWGDDHKVIDYTIDFLTADDDSWGFYPQYAADEGVGLFYYYRNVFTPDDKFRLQGSMGLRYRTFIEASMRRVSFLGGNLSTRWSARYHYQPDERFYGLGTASKLKDAVGYSHTMVTGDGGLEWVLSDKVSLESFYGVDYNEIGESLRSEEPSLINLPSLAALAGSRESVTLSRIEALLTMNAKNHPTIPTAGWEIRTGAGVFQQLDDDDYAFVQSHLDIKRYVHLFYQRVLEVRVGATLTDPFGENSDIPFYYLPELGDYDTIRGLKRGRFREADRVKLRLTYRYPVMRVWRRAGIDAFLYLDAGQVARDIFVDFDHEKVRTSGGLGFRFFTMESLLLESSFGHSRDGWMVQAVLKPTS